MLILIVFHSNCLISSWFISLDERSPTTSQNNSLMCSVWPPLRNELHFLHIHVRCVNEHFVFLCVTAIHGNRQTTQPLCSISIFGLVSRLSQACLTLTVYSKRTWTRVTLLHVSILVSFLIFSGLFNCYPCQFNRPRSRFVTMQPRPTDLICHHGIFTPVDC